MKCPNFRCNATNKSDAFYCHECGYQLRKRIDWALLFAVLFVLSFIAAVYFHTDISRQENNVTAKSEQEISEDLAVSDADIAELQNELKKITRENTALRREKEKLENDSRATASDRQKVTDLNRRIAGLTEKNKQDSITIKNLTQRLIDCRNQ